MFEQELEYQQEVKDLVRAAHLYFNDQKSQAEIAKLLDCSQSKVSRLLHRIRREGWVDITMNFPPLPSIASALIEKYGLRDALVIPSIPDNTQLKESLGMAGARYFERVVKPGASVGISCGHTLYYFVKHLKEGLLQGLKLYPLAGDNMLSESDLFAGTLVGIAAGKYRPNVTAYAMPAQTLNINLFSREAIEKEHKLWNQMLKKHYPQIAEIYTAAENVDVAVVGVGNITSETPGFCSYVLQVEQTQGISKSKSMLKELARLAVGEFNYNAFGRDGHSITRADVAAWQERILCVPIERFRSLSQTQGKLVIAICGGLKKLEAIRAVITGPIPMCNVLIVDSDVASGLLQ